MRWKRVGVLLGGISEEREISLKSGQAVALGLRRAGYDVCEIDAKRDLDQHLRRSNIDVAYLALHGPFGEDGTVQGLLEMIGIPYTGSSVTASAIAIDKVLTRKVLAAAAIPLPSGVVYLDTASKTIKSPYSLPVVVKPVTSGSSLGISIVREGEDFFEAVQTAFKYGDRALVEEFIDGTEVTVALLDGEILGCLEVEPHQDFYNYAAKYDDRGSTHHIPPRIPGERIDEVCELGRRVYREIGCSGAARVDLIVPEEKPAVVLEINTIPGMTETSLFPEIASAKGYNFEQLVSKIVEGARLHVGLKKS